jgi:hypothetical protein
MLEIKFSSFLSYSREIGTRPKDAPHLKRGCRQQFDLNFNDTVNISVFMQFVGKTLINSDFPADVRLYEFSKQDSVFKGI